MADKKQGPEERETFEYQGEKKRSGFDPLEIAKAQGQVFGAGISGR